MRDGADAWLVRRLDREPPEPGHKLVPVYVEMLLQTCRDYAGLPDPRTLTMTEIRFFYSGLRPELQKGTSGNHKHAPASTPARAKPKRSSKRK